MRALLISVFMISTLAACGGSKSPELTALENAALEAECAHAALAYQLTQQQYGKASAAQLAGCPNAPVDRGFKIKFIEDVKKTSQLASAFSADTSSIEARYGSIGTELYRKMIARGTPQDVALQVTNTAEFARTVQIYTQLKSR